MQVRAVIYHPTSFPESLYQEALASVDSESQARINKFYRREDACRTLIGRLLVRHLLQERGISRDNMKFLATPEGKPYLAVQTTDPPIAYNVAHDNGLIAIALGPGVTKPPAFKIGVDVMMVKVPSSEKSIDSFIEVVGDQLTEHERKLLKESKTEEERLEMFFWIWTMKEAYTKAVGFGLGFDFRRIDFNPHKRVVRVDGTEPQGWSFHMFTVPDGEDRYLGVVAECLGKNATTVEYTPGESMGWLTIQDAVSFVKNAVAVLKS